MHKGESGPPSVPSLGAGGRARTDDLRSTKPVRRDCTGLRLFIHAPPPRHGSPEVRRIHFGPSIHDDQGKHPWNCVQKVVRKLHGNDLLGSSSRDRSARPQSERAHRRCMSLRDGRAGEAFEALGAHPWIPIEANSQVAPFHRFLAVESGCLTSPSLIAAASRRYEEKSSSKASAASCCIAGNTWE